MAANSGHCWQNDTYTSSVQDLQSKSGSNAKTTAKTNPKNKLTSIPKAATYQTTKRTSKSI
jgi:hypothetical protein